MRDRKWEKEAENGKTRDIEGKRKRMSNSGRKKNKLNLEITCKKWMKKVRKRLTQKREI